MRSCHIAIPPTVLPTQTWRNLLEDPQHYGATLKPLVDPPRILVWRLPPFTKDGKPTLPRSGFTALLWGQNDTINLDKYKFFVKTNCLVSCDAGIFTIFELILLECVIVEPRKFSVLR